MINSISSKKRIGSFSVLVLTTILALGVFALLLADDDKSAVNAQVVDVDEPPTNATEELDVKIDATESLPTNGTIVVDISGADDIDIDAIPPEGVSIVVTNTTVAVTNNPVEISEGGATGAAATQPDTPGLDTGTSASNNENDEEGSTGGDDTGSSGSSEGDEPTSSSDSSEDEEEG